MKRFVFAVTLALALLAGSQNTARANGGGGFSISLGFSIGFSVSGGCQSGNCPSPYSNFAPSYGYAPAYGYGGYGGYSGYGATYGYPSPYDYYGGFGY
jgi:hypothetical protein